MWILVWNSKIGKSNSSLLSASHGRRAVSLQEAKVKPFKCQHLPESPTEIIAVFTLRDRGPSIVMRRKHNTLYGHSIYRSKEKHLCIDYISVKAVG